MERTITRAIPIGQLSSSNPNLYSETEYMEWKDTKSSIENDEFGSLAIKILDIISYFDYKFVVPTAIFTEPNSDKALKVLADKKLITFQNEDREFTIYRPFQLINTQKLRFHRFESDALESAVQLLEKVINLPEYSNQNTIILIDHAISVWDYVDDCEFCQDVIRNHAKFPVIILTKLIDDLESVECVKFGEKTTKRYGEVLGAFNENALHVETLTGFSYNLIEDYDKALSVLNKILIDYKDYSEKYDKIYLLAKYGKAGALLGKDENSKEGVELLDEVIKESKVRLSESDPVTLGAIYSKVVLAFSHQDDVDDALAMVNEVLPIVLKDDPNSDKMITFQFKVGKAMLLGMQKEFDSAHKMLDEIKPKIIYTDRNNVVEYIFAIGLATVKLFELQINEALDLMMDVKKSAQLYLHKDDVHLKELDKLIDIIANTRTKRSVNYAPSEKLLQMNKDHFEHLPFPITYDLKTNCLIKTEKLIEDVYTKNNVFTPKPIAPVSTNDAINLMFLIDLFLRKITGNKYVKSHDSFVPSKYNLIAASINICEKLENIFVNKFKNPELFDFAELQSVLSAALEKCSNCQQVTDILKTYIYTHLNDAENDADLSELNDLIERVIKNACNE